MAIKSFKARVLQKKQLTQSVILLTLSTPKDFSFKAGQFISLQFMLEDKKVVRSYSILSPPSQQDMIDLAVKLVEGGKASNVFSTMKVGDEIRFKGPFGHFLFDEETSNEHWFLGAGTGLAPLHSMILQYVDSGKMTLLFGVRTKENLFLDDEFKKLEQTHSNFTYIPVLSREKWSGAQGHVQDNLPKDLKNKTFYICGLKELVLETKELLSKRGVDAKDIRTERYS